jgi:hypothetical protein
VTFANHPLRERKEGWSERGVSESNPPCRDCRSLRFSLILIAPCNGFEILRRVCKPTAEVSFLPFISHLLSQPLVRSTRMQTTPRPLPKPPHLTIAMDTRPYRPLPTPPLQSTDSSYTSSTESGYLQTPSAQYITRDSDSFSSASSEQSSKPRLRLHISATPPTHRTRNSLDSLTVRSPALCDPDQALCPVVDRGNNTLAIDTKPPKRTARVPRRSSRTSAVNPDISPLVFEHPPAVTELGISEPEEDGKIAFAYAFSMSLD